ncbi:MAG: family 1 glycosylhydrolase, partial [bacterium]|nr:family 1 glycosylhydrolase [bacterium]
TLPQWVADQGGWEKASTVRHFERFAKKMAEEYAGYVDQWITINEPMIYLSQAYLSGAWPPGRKSVPATIRAFRNLCRAHRQAYQVIHSVAPVVSGKPASVGIAKNVISFDPYRKHARRDVWFVRLADWLWNHLFFSRTRNTHDFIGINYYFHYRVAFVPSEYHHFFFQVRNENREVSDVGWEVYPSGIFAAIQDMAIYKKPIYITENGIASTNDDKRIRFLVSHLKEVYHAIQSGIDVRGYFHWSLLDNFEWEKGFGPRFGLIEVDYDTMERKPRRSAGVYGSIAQQNGISHELLRFLGHRVL